MTVSLTLVAPRRDPAIRVLSALDAAGYGVAREGESAVAARLFDTHDGRLLRAGVTLALDTLALDWRYDSPQETLIEADRDGRPPRGGTITARLATLTGTRGLVDWVELHGTEERFAARIEGREVFRLSISRISASSQLRPRARARLPLCVVTGAEDELERAAPVLRDIGGCSHVARPPLAVAVAALGLGEPGAPPPAATEIAAGDSAVAAAAKVLARQAWTIEVNRPGTALDLDPEFLHDLRVATRRARAALRLLRPVLAADRTTALREELAWLGGVCGAVRDLDVFGARLADSLDLVGADPESRGAIVAAVGRDRNGHRETLVKALRSPRCAALVEALGNVDEQAPASSETELSPTAAVTDVAPLLVSRELRRVMRRRKQLGDDPDDEQLHRLRIDGKRARYACEFFAGVLAEDPARTIRALVRLQDCLGAHQDAVVAQGRLERLATERHRDGAGLAELLALGAAIQLERERRRDLRESFAAAARAAFRRTATLHALLAAPPATAS